jgi:hypothetical protein
MSAKILILAPEKDVDSLTAYISKLAIPSWNEYVVVWGFEERRGIAKRGGNSVLVQNSQIVLERVNDSKFEYVVCHKDAALDIKLLEKHVKKIYVRPKLESLREQIKDLLTTQKLHWRTHASSQWNHSTIKHINPEEWCSQFVSLGISHEFGANLLKLLRVIPSSDLHDAFRISEEEVAGLNVAHAYFSDDEPGASSIVIRHLLEHIYLPEDVVAISPANGPQFGHSSFNKIYIYEDGLWSGVELQNRLDLLNKHVGWRNIALTFRYAVTSDAGLWAGRLHRSSQNFSNVTIDAAKTHFKFLRPGSEARLRAVQSSDNIRDVIDELVEPYVFREPHVWGDELNTARDVLLELGRQLMKPFLQRREQIKRMAFGPPVEPTADIVIPEEKLRRWCLGALQFGSTVVFSSSIPKPVLPLFWLKGTVKWGEKTIEWHPLFWDVRRIDQVSYKI